MRFLRILRRRGVVLVAAGWLWALAPAVGEAATLHVASNGVDGFACGDAATPCRSISRAIALADEGDAIVVGPGRYGDLNGDGDFDDPGDEDAETAPGSCLCLIRVSRRALRIRSRDGAGATVLDAGGLPLSVVHVEADKVAFGGGKAGFTLVGGPRGVNIAASARDVTVEGNLALTESVYSDGDLYEAGFVVDGNRNRLRANAAIAGPGFGIVVLGSEAGLDGNLVSVNRAQGVYVRFGKGFGALSSTFAIANDSDGILVDVGAYAGPVARSVLVGNRGTGIALDRVAPDAAGVRRSNLYGNVAGNCGLWNDNAGQAIDARWNFWGFAGGPAEDPGDETCDRPGSETVTDPAARGEFRWRWRAPW